MMNFLFVLLPFFHKSIGKKEEIRELNGKCGQKSTRESLSIRTLDYSI